MINTDSSAELNFKKAESIRASQLHFWIIVLNGVIIALIPLLFNKDFREILLSCGYWLIDVIVSLTAITIWMCNTFYKLKYNEYRTKYVMLYSIDYLNQYCEDKKKPLNSIQSVELPDIVQSIYEKTFFNEKEILDGIYTYCFEVLRICPNWLDEQDETSPLPPAQ